jgi:hypothetical protein
MSEFNTEITAEMQPPAEQKPTKKRKNAEGKPAQGGKRGQPRPYRKLNDEILTTRISKLTARLERAKKQVRESVQREVCQDSTDGFVAARGCQAPSHPLLLREDRAITRHPGCSPRGSRGGRGDSSYTRHAAVIMTGPHTPR